MVCVCVCVCGGGGGGGHLRLKSSNQLFWPSLRRVPGHGNVVEVEEFCHSCLNSCYCLKKELNII